MSVVCDPLQDLLGVYGPCVTGYVCPVGYHRFLNTVVDSRSSQRVRHSGPIARGTRRSTRRTQCDVRVVHVLPCSKRALTHTHICRCDGVRDPLLSLINITVLETASTDLRCAAMSALGGFCADHSIMLKVSQPACACVHAQVCVFQQPVCVSCVMRIRRLRRMLCGRLRV